MEGNEENKNGGGTRGEKEKTQKEERMQKVEKADGRRKGSNILNH